MLFTRQRNQKYISVQSIVTLFYLESNSEFVFEGEAHDFWELAYIDKGSMIFTADDKEFLLQSGEMVFHKPNEFHRLEARRLSSPSISVISFVSLSPAMKYFENKIFKLTDEERKLFSSLLKEGLSTFSPLTPRPPIYGLKQNQNIPLGSKQMVFNLLEQFLLLLIRRSKPTIHRADRALAPMSEEFFPEDIKKIVEYMDNHIHQRLLISDIAQAFYMSENSLKKLFYKKAHIGVIECLNSRKLLKAKQLIRAGSLNISEISEILGFSSIHYFSNFFKQKVGMTPTEYRLSVKE